MPGRRCFYGTEAISQLADRPVGAASQSISLPSGAQIHWNGATGRFTCDPGQIWNALDEGESAQDSFDYWVDNGDVQVRASYTVTLRGEEDAPTGGGSDPAP